MQLQFLDDCYSFFDSFILLFDNSEQLFQKINFGKDYSFYNIGDKDALEMLVYGFRWKHMLYNLLSNVRLELIFIIQF